MKPFKNKEVAAVFNKYPKKIRSCLMFLRQLIIDTAAETKEVGELEETLKWGEPAYLPKKPKTGSTVRIDQKKSNPNQYAMYFHCQTELISTFKTLFPKQFTFEGNRALVFNEKDKIPVDELKFCIKAALAYHLNQKS